MGVSTWLSACWRKRSSTVGTPSSAARHPAWGWSPGGRGWGGTCSSSERRMSGQRPSGWAAGRHRHAVGTWCTAVALDALSARARSSRERKTSHGSPSRAG